MNKKIKMIDLLVKIANGEEVPIEIKFQNIIYVFNKECNQYYERGKGSYFDNKLKFDKTIEWNFYGDYLNEEVEILEDSLEDNTEEIEELPDYNYSIKENRDKINELVRVVKQIRKEIKND